MCVCVCVLMFALYIYIYIAVTDAPTMQPTTAMPTLAGPSLPITFDGNAVGWAAEFDLPSVCQDSR